MRKLRRFLLLSAALLSFSWLQAQVTNYALKLDGTDKVDCGQITEINGRDGYAVQFLISPSEWIPNSYIFQRGAGATEFSARLSSTAGNLIFKVGTQEITASAVETSGWTQLTFSVFPNGADVWVNATKTWVANTQLVMPESAAAFMIGEHFKGRIDEFRLWNTEMPGAEQDNLMFQNTINKFHPKWDNLVFYYKFDQELCPDNIVDNKNTHHATMRGAINREAVTDNSFFRYRVVSGYSDFNRHCDRLQIDKDMHLMTNDLILLSADVDGYTGAIKMGGPDDAVFSGGAFYMESFAGRNGVVSLDGTGLMSLGQDIIREGTPADASNGSTFSGWFNITDWIPGAELLKKEENESKRIRIYLGDYEDKELIVEANHWKAVFKNALEDIATWQHIGVVFNPKAGRGKIALYVNNSSKTGTIDRPENETSYVITDIKAEASIGKDFIGKMDDLMVWRNARTAFGNDMEGTSTELKFPGGGYSSIFLDAYWKFDTNETLGINMRSWKSMIRQIKDIYAGYRGFKVRFGLVSSTSYSGGGKVWSDKIGDPVWRAKLAEDVAGILPYCDGIDVDFEWLDNNPNNPKWASYGEMVKELRAVIPADKVFSVSLHPVSYTLPTSVIPLIDYITFQNYGPRPSNLVWSAYSAFYNTAVNYGIPAEKIHLSMATTIVKSDNSGSGVRGYKDLDFTGITTGSNNAIVDGVSYTFNGVDEVKKKMNLLVEKNAGGCMYFDMGNDISVQNDLSLIRALNTVIASNVDLLVTDVGQIGTNIREEKKTGESVFLLYPNPATDYVILETGMEGEEIVYELFTVSGSKLLTGKSAEQKIIIDVNDLSGGVYLLKINTAEKTFTGKIQKK